MQLLFQQFYHNQASSNTPSSLHQHQRALQDDSTSTSTTTVSGQEDEGSGSPVGVIVTVSWVLFCIVGFSFCVRRGKIQRLRANERDHAEILAVDVRRHGFNNPSVLGAVNNGVPQSAEVLQSWLFAPPHNGSVASFFMGAAASMGGGPPEAWDMTHTGGEPHGEGSHDPGQPHEGTQRRPFVPYSIKAGHITFQSVEQSSTSSGTEYHIRGSGHDEHIGAFTLEGRLSTTTGILVWTEFYNWESLTKEKYTDSTDKPFCFSERNGQKLQVAVVLVVTDPNTIVGRYVPNTHENSGEMTLRRPGGSYNAVAGQAQLVGAPALVGPYPSAGGNMI
eukprot:g5701.t1